MSPERSPHGQITKKEDDDEDPLEKLMKDTGCLELHYQVQQCIFETKDWRQCQTHVNNFRQCMEEHKKKSRGSH